MLACVLLAAMLGGIAMANPDLHRSDRSEVPRGGASHGGGIAIREGSGHADHDGHDGGDDGAPIDAVHTVAGCRAVVAHLQGDIRTGDHRGLAHAFEVVSRNCRTHTAPGLLRALDRLAANLERWQGRHGDGSGADGTPPGKGIGNDGDPPGQTGNEPLGLDEGSNAAESVSPDPGGQGSGGSGPSQGGGNGSGSSSA